MWEGKSRKGSGNGFRCATGYGVCSSDRTIFPDPPGLHVLAWIPLLSESLWHLVCSTDRGPPPFPHGCLSYFPNEIMSSRRARISPSHFLFPPRPLASATSLVAAGFLWWSKHSPRRELQEPLGPSNTPLGAGTRGLSPHFTDEITRA